MSIKTLKTPLKMLLSFLSKYRASLGLTVLATAMLLFRIAVLTEQQCADWLNYPSCPRLRFVFLLWNAFLAWLPLFFLELGLSVRFKGLLLWGMLLLAILFFPNAPYLITDLIHLRPVYGVPLWYDALLLFTFAYLGLSLAQQALSLFHQLLSLHLPKLRVQVVLFSIVFLSGVGIYLGRVLRWNSWDALLSPQGPVWDGLLLLLNPVQHLEAWLMIFLFSLLLACSYWVTKPVMINK
jgi:uncharacterized membrane protein